MLNLLHAYTGWPVDIVQLSLSRRTLIVRYRGQFSTRSLNMSNSFTPQWTHLSSLMLAVYHSSASWHSGKPFLLLPQLEEG